MAFITGTTAASGVINNFLATLTTFLVANGWVLHDDISASQKVFRSTGAGRERIFVALGSNGANRLTCIGFQWWNATSHVGFNPSGSAAVSGIDVTSADTQFSYWVWTDGRVIVIGTKNGSTYNGGAIGSAKSMHNGDVAFSTSSVASGASVVVPLDQSYVSNPDWQPGRKLMVVDQIDTFAGGGVIPCEMAPIVAITPVSVTLTLAQSHGVGAMIGVDPQPTFVTIANDIVDAYFSNDVTGAVASPGRLFADLLPFSGVDNQTDPNDRTGRYLCQELFWSSAVALATELRGKCPGVIIPSDGTIGSEDSATIGGGNYVALPIGETARQVFVPTF